MRLSLGIGILFFFFLLAGTGRADFLLVYDVEHSETVFRVNTETGEAHTLSRFERGVHRWVKIEETERIGRAAYQFAAVAEKGATRLVRLDPVSGSSWVTSDLRWEKVLEP